MVTVVQQLIHPGRLAVALSFLVDMTGFGNEALAALAARDVAANVGIVFPNRMTQGETPLIDVDSDGFPDIIINGHQRAPVTGGQNLGTWPILRWNGSAFVPYHTIEDLTDRHACTVADFGRQEGTGLPDGIADLYCVHGAAEGNCSAPDRNTPPDARCKHWTQRGTGRSGPNGRPQPLSKPRSVSRASGARPATRALPSTSPRPDLRASMCGRPLKCKVWRAVSCSGLVK